jgi:endonuclease/exonuclease/phosphatase family metal-dependent hydrolase
MLRLMTLNLNYRAAKHGDWDDRRRQIAHAIQRTQADVVALQAVERAHGAGQAAELAAMVDYQHIEYVAAVKTNGATRGSGFIARRRLGDVAVRRLSQRDGHEDKDRRVLLKTQIQTRGGAVDLYNAHFSWVLPQALDNARETLGFVAPGPALLFGDLNSAPDSQAVRTLTQAGWTDVWAALRPGDPGFTFEADRPSLRIDYALASPAVRERVRSIELIAADGGSVPRLSDHLGLLLTLSDS